LKKQNEIIADGSDADMTRKPRCNSDGEEKITRIKGKHFH
jgi:hypothetical protein